MTEMIKERAVVEKIIGDIALIRVQRTEACAGCAVRGMCHALGTQTEDMVVEALNEAGAEAGDVVMVAVPSRSLMKSTLVVYIIPLVALITGLFLGMKGASILELKNPPLWGFMGSLSLMALSFIFARWFDRKASKNPEFTPRVVQVIERCIQKSSPSDLKT